MPYRSDAQRRFFHSPGAKKAGITAKDVKHWDDESRGRKLPEKVKAAAFLDELHKLAFGPEQASLLARMAKKLQLKRPIANLTGPGYIASIEPGSGMESWLGKILYPPKHGILGYLRGASMPRGNLKSPADKKLLEQLGLAHEMAERKFSRGISLGAPNLQHAPGVIPVEHNMLSTLPPANSAVRDFFRQVVRAEDPSVKAFENATGGRIPYGSGPRLSRHARKHITEKMLLPQPA